MSTRQAASSIERILFKQAAILDVYYMYAYVDRIFECKYYIYGVIMTCTVTLQGSAHCTLHTDYCNLHTAHRALHSPTAHYRMHTVHCTLCSELCTLHTAHCTMHVAHCTVLSMD
jgi:hypothetical protein